MTDYNFLSEEEQIELVQKNGHLIYYINNPSEATKLAAVRKYGSAIKYINNPSEAVQLAAVKKTIGTLFWIKKPSKKVIKYCLYECDISHTLILQSLYSKLTSDKDKVYFKMKYGSIIND